MRRATGVVGCRMGLACTPIPLEMMRFTGEPGYESLFLLSLCEVGVDVVEDLGRVPVQAPAREDFCQVFERVARVVEWIVGVFVFARFVWFVHAVADCDPGGVEAGLGGCCGE